MNRFRKAKIFNHDNILLNIQNGSVDIHLDYSDIIFIFNAAVQMDSSDGKVYPFQCKLKSLYCMGGWKKKIMIVDEHHQILIKFEKSQEKKEFENYVNNISASLPTKSSIFDRRTTIDSSTQYFQFYSYLSQQQNMLSDRIRTETYQTAIYRNSIDFKDKIVLDVGTGTGVLSFFAIHAGAKKVYAIEASSMAVHAKTLIDANNLADRIILIHSKVEDIPTMEPIDIIISEPMGYMLFNERMLETYIHAKKWLKPNGKMFPTIADFWVVPFTDEILYAEVFNKSTFWTQTRFFGIDVSTVRENAVEEYFSQPVVDAIDCRTFISTPKVQRFDFLQLNEADLFDINIDLEFTIQNTSILHGFAFWFTVGFFGSQAHVYLSTAPDRPLTHWYQVRLLLKEPFHVRMGDVIGGTMRMVANNRQSYDITLNVYNNDTTAFNSESKYDLKNCYFRYFGPSFAASQQSQIICETISHQENSSSN